MTEGVFYLLVWFYAMNGVTYGPFVDEESCWNARKYHVEQWKAPASVCQKGWDERGLVKREGEEADDA